MEQMKSFPNPGMEDQKSGATSIASRSLDLENPFISVYPTTNLFLIDSLKRAYRTWSL